MVYLIFDANLNVICSSLDLLTNNVHFKYFLKSKLSSNELKVFFFLLFELFVHGIDLFSLFVVDLCCSGSLQTSSCCWQFYRF